jgi:hypothetical protein
MLPLSGSNSTSVIGPCALPVSLSARLPTSSSLPGRPERARGVRRYRQAVRQLLERIALPDCGVRRLLDERREC